MGKLNSIVFIVGWLLSIVPAASQSKIIKENRIWEYIITKGNDWRIDRYCFDGTEERGGKEYHLWKLIKQTCGSNYSETEPVETELDSVAAFLREEDSKVYMLLENETIRDFNSSTHILSAPFEAPLGEEGLLYDFSVKAGDSFSVALKILWAEEYPEFTQSVVSECSVAEIMPFRLTNSEVKKYVLKSGVHVDLLGGHYDTDDGVFTEEIILSGCANPGENDVSQTNISYAEVVGNTGRGNMTSLMPQSAIFLTSGIMDYQVSRLSAVYDIDGTIIFGIPSGISTACIVTDNIVAKIFDLHGREVSAPVPGSIYIREGKKFVAK